MSAVSNNLLIAGDDGYTIERSVRLRSSASAYLSRTPASAGNRKTWTWSAWVKRGALNIQHMLLDVNGGIGGARGDITFTSSNTLQVEFNSSGSSWDTALITTQVFRDPSAWYHVIVTLDTTQATSTNRLKVYVNGSQITAFGTATYPAQNVDQPFNTTSTHNIGRISSGGYYLDGYLTEVNFIDGQALTPDSFGEYDSITGVWKPAKYTSTYGTNGFYLNFSDNTTTTTLAEDKSGNGNDWTANNISLTSGATYDSMTDTPTIYADGGNYATLNPLVVTNAAPTTFSEANLRVDFGSSSTGWGHSTIGMTTGKWYSEFTLTSVSSTNANVGLKTDSSLFYAGFSANSYAYQNNGNKFTNDSGSAYGASFTSGDVIGVAYDADAGTLTFYKNGASQGQAFSGITGTNYFVVSDNSSAAICVWQVNFGQRPFTYTPPTGFLPLHTGNLPDSSIVDGSKHFDVVTYTGNSTDNTAIGGLEFEPSLVWLKSRSNVYHHALFDQIRGGSNALYSSLTNAETTESGVKTFEPDGFTLGTSSGSNYSGFTYVAWNWKANGTGVSNTDGSITSTVSANPTAGFSIVSYTGNQTAGATVGHGLGSAPKMLIVKGRGQTSSWMVKHESLASNQYLYLNLTNAATSTYNIWNSTSPTSSVFTLGSDGAVNESSYNYVAYCFAEVEGYSKFGSYTGNGSADGTFVYTGFRPAFLLFKRTDSTADWTIHDFRRLGYNSNDFELYPNGSYAETGAAGSARSDFLSNGFKIRANSGGINASGGTYIYMAFSENPFKNSLAR